LEHLERNGVRVLNGAQAFRHEISKASQASLLKSLGLRFIPTRVIHSADQALAAAAAAARESRASIPAASWPMR
jgi:glutathione synthase/RimK-type ligase-like ATP-grasp enzyme